MEKRTAEDYLAGQVLYFRKPLHWTSFKLVRHIRGHLVRTYGLPSKLKVGHAGTLDPLAEGVMIICTGKATKRIETFQYQTKEYVARIQLGSTTPSFDLETAIDAHYPFEHITREVVLETLPRFMGSIWQTPPAFSACKVDGKRAYEMARKGEAVELQPKELVIDEIELVGFEPAPTGEPILELRVVCSKGTYIRALARDIGLALGSGGHLIGLIRTRVGEATLQCCQDIEEINDL